MTHHFDIHELDQLALDLTRPGAAAELGVLVVCLLAAWLVARLLRGRSPPQPQSVLFGQRVVDGLLFPMLALAFAYIARTALEATIKPAVFRVAIPILVSLVVIRLTVRVLTRSFPNVSWVRTVERSIVEGTITAGIVLVVALWISGALERHLLNGRTGQDLSLRKIAATLIRTALLFIGLMLALSAVGIDLTALSVFGGAIGVGIGFGLQKIAANYMSGFIILAERSVRIGDMVKIDTFEGRITDIRTRYTIIRSLGGREAIVPNETLITSRVENLSLADPRVVVQTSVQVAYGTDVRALLPQIETAITKVPRVIAEPAPNVQLAAFAADGIDLNINFWIADSHNGTGGVKSAVNLVILDVLDAAGVEIPFPQRVVRAVISREPKPIEKAGGDPLPT